MQRFRPLAAALACEAHLAGFDGAAAVRSIACRVTVIHGEPWLGSLLSVADLEALRGLLPWAELVRVPGAGHDVRRDRPEPFARAALAAIEVGQRGGGTSSR